MDEQGLASHATNSCSRCCDQTNSANGLLSEPRSRETHTPHPFGYHSERVAFLPRVTCLLLHSQRGA